MKEIFRQTIFAHRGFFNNSDVPENSLRAFELAVERGWGVELDVHLLRDGSLVVFHDSDIKRMTGAVGTLEELDFPTVKALRLLGTTHGIPTFQEVLAVLEGKSPVIIELKTKNQNAKALVEAVCSLLDQYTGDYVVESFDPMAVYWMKKYRPEVTRGILTEDFRKDPKGLGFPMDQLLTAQVFNRWIDPHFVAFQWKDRNCSSIRREIEKNHRIPVTWTIRNREDLRTCLEEGIIPIFDSFDPEVEEE